MADKQPENFQELQEYQRTNPMGSFPSCILEVTGMQAQAQQSYGSGEWIRFGDGGLYYYPSNNGPRVEWMNTGPFEAALSDYRNKGDTYNSDACVQERDPGPLTITISAAPSQTDEGRARNTDGQVVVNPGAAEEPDEEPTEEQEDEDEPRGGQDFSGTTSDDMAEELGLDDPAPDQSGPTNPSPSNPGPSNPGPTNPAPSPPSGPPTSPTGGLPTPSAPGSGPVTGPGATVPGIPGGGVPGSPAPGSGGFGNAVGEWWDGLSTGQQVAVGAAAAVGVVAVGAAIAYVGGTAALAAAALVAARFLGRFALRAIGWLARQAWKLAKQAVQAVRRGVERIVKWVRRRLRGCKKGTRNPVYIDDGTVSQEDPRFEVPGIFQLAVTSVYQSDIRQWGPLGWGRVSDLDTTLERLDNGKLRYRDGAGYYVDFERPTPNLGHWGEGDHVRRMQIAAGPRRSFMVREEGLVKYFHKHRDGLWRLREISDRNVNTLKFSYDDLSNLTRVETPEGLALDITTDPRTNLRSQVDLIGRDGTRKTIMRYAYDSFGNLTLAECPFGDKHEYRYDSRRLRIWARINDQYEANYTYDDQGRCILERTNGPNDGTALEYHPDLNMTRVIPSGDRDRMQTYYYDQDGTVFGEAHVSGRMIWTYFDEEGNVSAIQDGNGNRTSYGYDPQGNATRRTDAEGRTVDYRWTEDRQIAVFMDQDGSAWENSFDERGNLISSRNPDGTDVEFRVNDSGLTTGICRSDGMIRTLDFDDQHWLVREIDFDGFETRLETDAFGRITTIIEADTRRTEYRYPDQDGFDFWSPSEILVDGALHKQISVTEPRRRIEEVDGLGRRNAIVFDAFGKVDETIDAMGRSIRFAYNRHEELVSVTNQKGNIWQFERDAFGRVSKEIDFGGRETRYAYDDADRLIGVTSNDGSQTDLTMDKSGLLTRELVRVDGQDDLKTTFAYDSRGLLQQAINSAGTVTFERDVLGQIIREDVNGFDIQSTYNCCGMRVARSVASGADRRQDRFHYDPVGRLIGLDVGPHERLRITRDHLGHESRRMSAAGFDLQQQFTQQGLLDRQAAPQRSRFDAPVVERSYSWTKGREPNQIRDARWGVTGYSYDQNGQLSHAEYGDLSTDSFAYDPCQTIESASFLSNDGQATGAMTTRFSMWQSGQDGRVERASGADGRDISLTYDSRGRVVEKTAIRPGFRPAKWRFEWDGQDRLITSYPPDETKWTYGYDAFGRRLFKQQWTREMIRVEGIPTQSWVAADRHEFRWDRDVLAAEIITRDGDQTRVDWLFHPDGFEPLARLEAGRLSYVVTDHLGTPRELVSQDGRLEWAAEFATWGALKRLTGPDPRFPVDPDQCPIRFQGQYWDRETGLHYNRHRYYDPDTSTYISLDPLGLDGGPVPHQYSVNPVITIDPLGLYGVYVFQTSRGNCYVGKGGSGPIGGRGRYLRSTRQRSRQDGSFQDQKRRNPRDSNFCNYNRAIKRGTYIDTDAMNNTNLTNEQFAFAVESHIQDTMSCPGGRWLNGITSPGAAINAATGGASASVQSVARRVYQTFLSSPGRF